MILSMKVKLQMFVHLQFFKLALSAVLNSIAPKIGVVPSLSLLLLLVSLSDNKYVIVGFNTM